MNNARIKLTVGKAVYRLRRAGKALARRWPGRTDAEPLTDEAFLRRLHLHGEDTLTPSVIERHFQTRTRPRLPAAKQWDGEPWNPDDSIRNTLVQTAQDACRHRFRFLGIVTEANAPLDWHVDPNTHYRWRPDLHHADIDIPLGEADIKRPWELSRMAHGAMLGAAFHATGDQAYAGEWVKQIEDWIRNNPYPCGVNWSCTMEVAIRACNWVLGYALFQGTEALNGPFLTRFIKGVYEAGRHIRANLERDPVLHNHYLADVAGLVVLSTAFPEFRDAPRWQAFGRREIVRQMQRQVYNDGCHFEAATCYHRLALELFFFPAALLAMNAPGFREPHYAAAATEMLGPSFVRSLYDMFDAVYHLLKPNGHMPQVGDNDSSRLFTLYPRSVTDMRYLLGLGAVFFNEARWRVRPFFESDQDAAEIPLFYGLPGKRCWDTMTSSTLADVPSKAFPDAGWYVMRGGANYALVSCGPNGQNGRGGHAHNDKLSFELVAGGKDLVIDPGTYAYTGDPAARNRFRATASHSTVVIDGQEQNTMNPQRLFSLGHEAEGKARSWQTGSEEDTFAGEHGGYTRLSRPVVHRRRFRFRKKAGVIHVTDAFDGHGEHAFEWHLVLAPGAAKAIVIESDGLTWQERPASYSPEYGVLQKTTELVATLRARTPLERTFRVRAR